MLYLSLIPHKIVTWPNPFNSSEPLVRLAATVVVALVVIILGLALSRAGDSYMRRFVDRHGAPLAVGILLGRLVAALFLGIAFLILLGIIGVGLTPLTALIGIAGLAISLSLQSVMQNLVAGVYLLAERPFHINDVIVIAGDNGIAHTGKVEDISIRITRLRGLTNEEVLVPNAMLFNNIVTNTTAAGGYVTQVAATFPRATTPDDVRQHLFPLLMSGPDVLSRPQPTLQIQTIDADTWTGCISFWVEEPGSATETMWKLGQRFPKVKFSAGGS